MIRIELQLPAVTIYSIICFMLLIGPSCLGFVLLSNYDLSSRLTITTGVVSGILLLILVLLLLSIIFPLNILLLIFNLFGVVVLFITFSYWLSLFINNDGIYPGFIILTMVSLMALTAFVTFGITRYSMYKKTLKELEYYDESNSSDSTTQYSASSPNLSNSTAAFSPSLEQQQQQQQQQQNSQPPPQHQEKNENSHHPTSYHKKQQMSIKKSKSSSLTINNNDHSSNNSQQTIKGHLKDKASSHSLLSFLVSHNSNNNNHDNPDTNTNTNHTQEQGANNHHHRSESSILQKIPQSLIPAHFRTGSQISNIQHKNQSNTSLGFDNWDVSSLSARERMMWTLNNMNSTETGAGGGHRHVSDGSSKLSTKTGNTTISTNHQNALINRAGFTKEEKRNISNGSSRKKNFIIDPDTNQFYSLYDQERMTKA